ncbi:MAG: phosphodiester glycosidase family protein [Clostridia bacterium]|nr:phosphodiester glycosidase family protein [Clostridia bacterium]
MKKHTLIRNILIDLLITGVALVVFALFHHVLPRQQQSLGFVIPNPLRQEESGSNSGLALPENAVLIASAGINDSAPLLARGGKQQSSGRNGKGGMNTKGGSALNGSESEAEAEAAEDETAGSAVTLSEKFAGKYTESVVVTENSYSSPDISITVTENSLGRTTYYLADIYVRDITCFQSALARDTYGSGFRDSIENMALLNNALLAVNGDYYGNTGEGVVIRNGVIYRANRTDCDVCVLYYDGTMRVMPGSSFSVEDAIAQGAWQAWTFGPALLDLDGSVLTSFSSTSRIISANPRTAIGYYEPGHYCLIVVDGRGDSAGISLPDLSQLFYDLGCQAAYNLDGGNSSIMVWNNQVINEPSGGGRESSDALLIAEVESYE